MISLKVNIVSGKISERNVLINDGETYEDLLEHLRINPETVIILSDDSPVPIDDVVSPGVVEIIRVVSTD